MPDFAWRMADVVQGGELLPNPVGTAPGQWVEAAGCTLVLLPGVPSELEAMLTGLVAPRLGRGSGILTRALRLAGVYESMVEQRVMHLYDRFGRENVTILAGRGQVTLLLMAEGARRGSAPRRDGRGVRGGGRPRPVRARTTTPSPSVVLARLRQRGLRLAVAESCTGGLVASQLVSVAGASDVFLGGVVAYADDLKTRAAGRAGRADGRPRRRQPPGGRGDGRRGGTARSRRAASASPGSPARPAARRRSPSAPCTWP